MQCVSADGHSTREILTRANLLIWTKYFESDLFCVQEALTLTNVNVIARPLGIVPHVQKTANVTHVQNVSKDALTATQTLLQCL